MHSQSTGVVARRRGAASGCRGRTKVAAKPSMSFAALAESSDDDLSDSETATKLAPSDVVLDSSHDSVATELESLGADWAAVERRRKPETTKLKELRGIASQVASTTSRSCAASTSMIDDDDAEAIDADWFLRKGQRHGWSKRQKQEWNFKAKLRVDYAKQKRDGQRSAVLV